MNPYLFQYPSYATPTQIERDRAAFDLAQAQADYDAEIAKGFHCDNCDAPMAPTEVRLALANAKLRNAAAVAAHEATKTGRLPAFFPKEWNR